MKLSRTASAAFSLVELSIVLVILGLLTGGILAGQSLIRASELRAVSVEYGRYVTATQSFRDKYFGYPGDFNQATRYWGRLNSNADCVTSTGAAVATPGACDGDNNGHVDSAGGGNASGEMFQFWKHLANAGLIEGSYSGLSGSSTYMVTDGTNVPRSKLSGGDWTAWYLGIQAGDARTYAMDYGNAFIFGSNNNGDLNLKAILKPEEAWNIDKKMDDGMPGSGRVIALYWNNACATAASDADYTSPYNLSNTSLQCVLYFVKAF